MASTTSIDKLIDDGRGLLRARDQREAHRGFYDWDDSVASWLDSIAPESGLSAQWSSLPSSNLLIGDYCQNGPQAWEDFRKAVQNRLQYLSSIAASLRTPVAKPGHDKAHTGGVAASLVSGKVFVVHGRDESRRESVARFIEKLGLKPIILHEQPSAGRTIIEKFVHYADVSFAVVILTADDHGGLIDSPVKSLLPRARQNVVFELGFFIAKLGRQNVCVLYEKGVELPSLLCRKATKYQPKIYLSFHHEL